MMDSLKYFGMEDSSIISSECIYSAVQRVNFKCEKKKEREIDLRLSLTVSQKSISLHVTDDDDPYFLFCLNISEEDFKHIKVQQSLLVDFDNFPRQLVKLLEQCKTDIGAQGPRFLLLIESKEEGKTRVTYFKVIETNLFKNLCHLDLRITSGSDTDLMKLMVLQINTLKDESSSRLKELVHTSARLNDCVQQLVSKQEDQEKFLQQWEEDKKIMIMKLNAEITKEKDKYLAAKVQLQAEEEEKRKELQCQHDIAVKTLHTEINELSSQNRNLFEKNCLEESTKREKCGQLEFHEKERAAFQNEIATLRNQNSKLDHDYHESNKVASVQRTKISMLEVELKDSKEIVQKQQELLKKINDQKIRFEEGFREKETALERKQVTLSNVADELMKANDIISKLQAELVVLGTKLSQRTQIALEQERVLVYKTHELIEAEKKVGELCQNLEEATINEKNVTELLAASSKKIVALENQVTGDRAMMDCIVRQMTNANNERQNIPGLGLTTAPDPKFTTLSRQNVNPGNEPQYASEGLPPFMRAGIQNLPYPVEGQHPLKAWNTSAGAALTGLPQSDTSRPSTFQQPPMCAATKTAYAALTGQPESYDRASVPALYQQPCASKTDTPTSTGVVQSNGASRPATYQQPPRNAASKTDTPTSTGVIQSNGASRPATYQQPPRNAASNGAQGTSWSPKSKVSSRLTAYQHPPQNAASDGAQGTSNWAPKSKVSSRLTAYQQPQPKFTVTFKGNPNQQPPVVSAYFPKTGNEPGKKPK